jgi:hypothetical protein
LTDPSRIGNTGGKTVSLKKASSFRGWFVRWSRPPAYLTLFFTCGTFWLILSNHSKPMDLATYWAFEIDRP